jgi:hypothetical protein
MRYLDSFRFITSRPGWFMNLVMCAVCMFIPIIGVIVLMGYMFEVFDELRRDPERKSYSNFEFNRFSPYLMRGIWPFLVQLLAQAVVMFPLGLGYGLVIGISVAARGNGAVLALVWALFAILAIVFSLFVSMCMWPMLTYAGVSQRFDFSGMIAYTRDFMRKMLVEIILTILFLSFVGTLIVFVGLLACCVGAYVAGSAVMLAQYHLKVQLYDLYLQRGGVVIPEPPVKSGSV